MDSFYSGTDNVRMKEVQGVLTQLQQHPESWRLVQTILEHSHSENTQYYALSLLTTAVKSRWNVLPIAERVQIPKYLYELSMSLGGSRSPLLTKINETMVLVLKKVWPKNWGTFVEDLVGSAVDPVTVGNNLAILSLFVEDVLDFGDEEVVSRRAQQLKEALLQKFPVILNFCLAVIEKALDDSQLRIKALQCAALCLKHTPITFTLGLDIPNIILTSCYENYDTRVQTIRCLTEIFEAPMDNALNTTMDNRSSNILGANILAPEHVLSIIKCWSNLMNACKQLSLQTLTGSVPFNMKQFWETFYLSLALCVSSFHKRFFEPLIERPNEIALMAMKELGIQPLQLAVDSIEIMSIAIQSPSDEIFRVCVEFWRSFSERFDKALLKIRAVVTNDQESLLMNKLDQEYQQVLSQVRKTLIRRMAKPPEVYVVYDEDTKCTTKHYQPDTDEIALYNTLKDTLRHLTRIQPSDTEHHCNEILQTFNDSIQKGRGDGDWNIQLLNRLCWSVGSISGIMDPKTELNFLLVVLRALLGLCQQKSGKENKALIAAMIMYVMGQFPRFLRENEQLLKVVTGKCLEFMEDTFPGVQDMACETFYKIAQSCSRPLVLLRNDDGSCYVDYLISILPRKVNGLSSSRLTLLVYSGVSMCIASHPDSYESLRLLELMMQPLNQTWASNLPMIYSISDPNALPLDVARTVTQIIAINNCAAESMADIYTVNQFPMLLTDILQIYEKFENHIQVQSKSNKLRHAITTEMRSYRKATLKLFDSLLQNYTSAESHSLLEEKILPYILQRVFVLYENQNPELREYEVLMLADLVLKKWSNSNAGLSYKLDDILRQLFAPSLEMIKTNYDSYPELRKNFFTFLRTVVSKCFEQCLGYLTPFVMSFIFGIQHESPEVGMLALEGLVTFIIKIGQTPHILKEFIVECCSNIVKETVIVMTDTAHNYGFREQTKILFLLHSCFRQANVPSYETCLIQFLASAYPNLNVTRCEILGKRIALAQTEQDSRTACKDLLISLKEFAGSAEEDLI
ncbi:putative exportin 1-like protein [Gregarina niphandrodes]|uniref:Exportin 1-like protein n=1 Tax=Gregarina niphandrodes TaxID=110365 RepID=A0A023BA73_GRENI|nr:putative exportin 1-like protein [Gregarina niphandrodes]EZG78145.1 putative exportin 1-like protein [Gregarina niphandrodes]|eukprot:XP_011129459.1 putative exportin 1-like protein [Gregarina niphandrodes]